MRALPECVFPFLVKAEGLRLKAYKDSVGKWTIGVGHCDVRLHDGMTVTLEQAMELLRSDLEIARNRLYRQAKADVLDELTDHQYAALLSFTFNLGARPDATLWKVLNKRQFELVPRELIKWVKGEIDGKLVKIEGLVNRRTDEIALWSTEEPGSVAITLPSAQVREMEIKPATAGPTAFKSPVVIASGGAGLAGLGGAMKLVKDGYASVVDQLGDLKDFHITTPMLIALGMLLATGLAAYGLTLMFQHQRDARR